MLFFFFGTARRYLEPRFSYICSEHEVTTPEQAATVADSFKYRYKIIKCLKVD